MGASERTRDTAIVAVLGVVVALHVAYYGPRVVDDLFISLRYAENLATGRGAVFNVGERVEGYSSPSWMLLQSFGVVCGLEAVTFTKVLGVAALVGLVFGARALARLHGVTTWHAWIPAFAVAFNSYVVNWAVLGLETPLHLALIVIAPVVVARAVGSVARRDLAVAALVLVVAGMTRPEALAYVGINLGAAFVAPATRRRAILLAAATLGALAVFFLVRHAYYGDWLPNTYYVKGAGSGFSLKKVRALGGDGSAATEVVFNIGGLVLLAHAAVRLRLWAPILTVLFDLYFTASVATDWMPSLRHLLPVVVLAPVGWAWGLANIAELVPERWRESSSWAALAFVAATCLQIASVDHRVSRIEHRNAWVIRKSAAKLADVLSAYRRIEPAHIAAMGPYELGQISQAWPVLETSAEPIAATWYAGRDIGAVGYYTDVRVFDVAGLVTREVSTSREWTVDNRVTPELADTMFARHPVSADLWDGWDVAAGARVDLLRTYKVTMGTRQKPNRIIATDRAPPSRSELLARYRAFAAKFPQRYHLQTLYGENVGAAVERRLRVVEATP